MAERLIRIYQELDVKTIKSHLMIYGDLSGSCASCQYMDIKWGADHCPSCKIEFKFITFRNIQSHWPKVHKLKQERPQVEFIDFEDYKRGLDVLKAKEFLK